MLDHSDVVCACYSCDTCPQINYLNHENENWGEHCFLWSKCFRSVCMRASCLLCLRCSFLTSFSEFSTNFLVQTITVS